MGIEPKEAALEAIREQGVRHFIANLHAIIKANYAAEVIVNPLIALAKASRVARTSSSVWAVEM
jgi:hypothetical protein